IGGGALLFITLTTLVVARAAPATPPHLTGRPFQPKIREMGQVSAERLMHIRQVLARVESRVDHDFGVARPVALTAIVYARHQAFGTELHHLEGLGPQSSIDNMGNDVHGLLPIGPYVPSLPHSLAHVYTEAVLDRLTHNLSDRQPDPAWLYDGLAEVEAGRLTGPLLCTGPHHVDFPLATIAHPRSWWKIRGGPFGDQVYCEAAEAASGIVSRWGWRDIVLLLHRARSWPGFAATLTGDRLQTVHAPAEKTLEAGTEGNGKLASGV
ncbi:MAG TPA: hypothetical protein VFB34_14145, partial [Chloroflexota bacterium]|nr:hypothetical protein [Chloroflexota bacterium]